MRPTPALFAALCLLGCDRDGQAVADEPAEAAIPELRRAEEPIPAAIAEQPELLEPPPEAPTDPSPEAEPDETEYIEPEQPPLPQAPADYGVINPPDPIPAESELTTHALVGYEVVAVYAKPDKKSARLGYLRIGTRLMVTDKVKGVGCKGGWYGVPNGGYACAGKGGGLVVDRKRPPYMHVTPPKPKMESGLPYRYALVRKWNTPMYWRVPTAEEQVVAAKRRAVLEAKREGKPLPPDPVASKAAAPKPAASDAPAKPAASTKPTASSTPAKGEPKGSALAGLPKPPGTTTETGKPADKSVPTPAAAKTATPSKATPAAKPTASKPTASKPTASKPTATETPEPKPTEPEPEPIRLPLNPDTSWLGGGLSS